MYVMINTMHAHVENLKVMLWKILYFLGLNWIINENIILDSTWEWF